ncbi:hypothetical protein G7046_g8706 [Stylonectria norvegica]|nr:hypothetical protein G7046_g8706 [Stylonectria norvegica]
MASISGNNSDRPEDAAIDSSKGPREQASGQQERDTSVLGWRPGKSPANVEWNVGNKRERSETMESSSTDKSPAPKRIRRLVPVDWEPPLAVGAHLGDNLSRLEEADRLVLQWEAILENSRKTQPSADLSSFERQLEKVTRERDQMEETEENIIPIEELESTKRERIQERIEILRGSMERNNCPNGEVNIRAAIEAYNDGRIQCWDKWTLLYAGHIADFCPSYESFTVDREERLDGYFTEYGPGWLWYEPPLAPEGNVQPDHLLAATWAQRSKQKAKAWGGSSGWDISMGFRRVKTFHSRTKEGPLVPWSDEGTATVDQPFPHTVTGKSTSATKNTERRSSLGKKIKYKPKHTGLSDMELRRRHWSVKDDAEGPRCFFLMHLDSGASCPCLYGTDLDIIGIDTRQYPPQTEMPMSTANGLVNAPMFEMRVDVCRHNGESLVGDDPVWPQERHELGGIFPVAVMPTSTQPPKGDSGPLDDKLIEERRRGGEDVSEKGLATRKKKSMETRLSGLLPFQVCYTACAPGMDMWFGEDRRDVLGADRMPGQRRYERHKTAKPEVLPVAISRVGRPESIIFDHQMGPRRRLVDADVAGRPGASVLTVTDGAHVRSFHVEPRRHEVATQQPMKMEIKKTEDALRIDKRKILREASDAARKKRGRIGRQS